MRKKKGEYGYRDGHRKLQLLITLLLVLAIAAQLLARQFTGNQAAKNILTVMAILTVLPMANVASPLLASWKYRTPPQAFYEQVKKYEDRCVILYDSIITSKDALMPMDAVAVHPTGVYFYCTGRKTDVKKAEEYLNGMLSAQRLDPHAKVIKEETAFFRRLDSLKPQSEYEDDGSLNCTISLVKNLSM